MLIVKKRLVMIFGRLRRVLRKRRSKSPQDGRIFRNSVTRMITHSSFRLLLPQTPHAIVTKHQIPPTGFETAFIELEGKRNTTHTDGATQNGTGIIKKLSYVNFREWFPERSALKMISSGQPMESEMATFRNLLCHLGCSRTKQILLCLFSSVFKPG
ncbi:hypothetical protein AVEN_114520-1 [Araneus ventricosus]|uniref:Uncharacterized protein n=1 Tax=Araneus ventricosus TaxID=182803 RepID=A0A4Y2SGC4_ARAVE|nr:hypothetical protein AVEN_114520-1 [Araneus ventricosus]